MGASERRKGAAAEREAAALLTDLLGVETIRRRLNQTRDGGHDLLAGPCRMEVKRQERASLHSWMSQAEGSAVGSEDLPAVMWRPSRRGWLVVMTVEDWAQIVRETLR